MCYSGCPFEPGEFSEGLIRNEGYPVLELCAKCRKMLPKARGYCSGCGEAIESSTEEGGTLVKCCSAEMMRKVREGNLFSQTWNAEPMKGSTLGAYVNMSIQLARLSHKHDIGLMLYLGESLTLVKRCMGWFVNERLQETGVLRKLPGVKVTGSLTTGGESAMPSMSWQDYFARKLAKGVELARAWNPSGPPNLTVGIADYGVSGGSFKALCKYLSTRTFPDVEKFQVVMFCAASSREKLLTAVQDYNNQGKFAEALVLPFEDFLPNPKLGGDTPKNFQGRGSIKRAWDDFGEKRRYRDLEDSGVVSQEDAYFERMKTEIHDLLRSGNFDRG
ncbi:hypothetical protein SAMN05443572_10487 [Myxococcus fulvus]|uniref:Uncharacterized protein n=1 Tax=Myxococcus fulvus TaxID=33 RepID=A0A511SZH5_MYXFU|nr:hypothetical protein MFU01_23280 [Myxococcus fulvus]SET96239.1 hypothetical protein SAMN05443572_10487 [Myxococcus fulvus]